MREVRKRLKVVGSVKEDYLREERKPFNAEKLHSMKEEVRERLGSLLVEPEDTQPLRGQG